MDPKIRRQAIEANLAALAETLRAAADRAAEAAQAARGFEPASRPANAPNMNQAIGTVVGLETELAAAQALLGAALALHRG